MIRNVSILILLDYLFLSVGGEKIFIIKGGFNPYFTGLPILMSNIGTVYMFLQWFQSLFYWITYSYNLYFLSSPVPKMFQSLFYWITYSYWEK